jgi:hypothetical protein
LLKESSLPSSWRRDPNLNPTHPLLRIPKVDLPWPTKLDEEDALDSPTSPQEPVLGNAMKFGFRLRVADFNNHLRPAGSCVARHDVERSVGSLLSNWNTLKRQEGGNNQTGGVGRGNGSNPRVNFGREALAKVGDKAVVDARGHGSSAGFDVGVAENFSNLVGFVMKEAGITLLGEFLF